MSTTLLGYLPVVLLAALVLVVAVAAVTDRSMRRSYYKAWFGSDEAI